ncbi:hypothetical protein [Nocardia wallacei]|uniref:hypothetical protein n=1 Tax=Nocardia wallacei TaxID=480035 RepID=UPI0024565F4B|nr:hypothetical protein [Nocardia wallacei]
MPHRQHLREVDHLEVGETDHDETLDREISRTPPYLFGYFRSITVPCGGSGKVLAYATGIRMSSNRNASIGLDPKTLPITVRVAVKDSPATAADA